MTKQLVGRMSRHMGKIELLVSDNPYYLKQRQSQDKDEFQSINTGETPVSQDENSSQGIKEETSSQSSNSNSYQQDSKQPSQDQYQDNGLQDLILLESATQTHRIKQVKEEEKEKLMFLRKTTNPEEYDKTISKLVHEGDHILLIYFLIESEIYNDQMKLLVMLKILYEKKQEIIFNQLLCPKEIIKYIGKCGDIGKISDILLIAFLKKGKYERSFYSSICDIIQKKIDDSGNEQSDFFLTNFFRIMVNSKRYNKNSGQYAFPQKSQISANNFLMKIRNIIQYPIAYLLQHNPGGIKFTNIEVIKAIIDYIFLLKTDDFIEVHYIKYLFDLIKPSLDEMSIEDKYKILRYVLECLMIKYDEKDPVKYPYASSILLAYYEDLFLNQENEYQFNINQVFPNIQLFNEYEVKNLMVNIFYSCPTEFVFLVMQKLAEELCQLKDELIQTCLYQDIFINLILAKVLYCTKKDGRITQLCNLISSFLYIYEDKIQTYSKEIFQILKYNNFIFNAYSESDQINIQNRIDDYCRVVRQIIFHNKLTEDIQKKMIKAYDSVQKQIKEEIPFREFNKKLKEFKKKKNVKDTSLNKNQYQGIDNFTNTCYFNSLMQIILRLDIFREYLFETHKAINNDFFRENRDLMDYLNQKKKLSRDQLQIKVQNIIGLAAPHFQWGTQNDPQELLINYIKKLYFDSKKITSQYQMDKSPVLMELLNTEKFRRKMCSKCKIYSQYKKEQFNCIQLYIAHKSSNLDFFELTKQVTSNQEKITVDCPQCQSKTQMDNDELYSQVAPILVFQIMRTTPDGKDSRKVNFPEFFNFLEIQNNGINFPYEQSNYRLVGIVNHIGNNTFAGHYVSYMRHEQTNKWIMFNDSSLTFFDNKSSIHQILEMKTEHVPYLLIYQNFSVKTPISKEKQIEGYLDRFKEYDKYYVKD